MALKGDREEGRESGGAAIDVCLDLLESVPRVLLPPLQALRHELGDSERRERKEGRQGSKVIRLSKDGYDRGGWAEVRRRQHEKTVDLAAPCM